MPKGSSVPGADSDAWKSPGGDGRVEWSGLEPNTEYDVYARMKGSDTKEPSGPSPATTVKTPVVTVTNVVLNSEGAKKVYTKGEALDVTGLTLEVSRSDDSRQTVDVTADMVSGFEGSRIAEQTLSVTYEGFTRTYEIVVTKSLSDVPEDSWFHNVVSRAVGLGLFNGYDNGTFGPNDKVTRGQVAVVLWNMTGHPEPGTGGKEFSDVDAGKYYANAIGWAAQVGVVNGYGNGRFGPDDNVTREQLAVMVCNYAREVAGKETTGSASDYAEMKDATNVSKWAVSSVGWCFQNEIVSGTEDGYINPQGNATRAEAAKMLVYLHDLLRT